MRRNLSPKVAKGMYGGPRGKKGGDYQRANLEQNSGGVLGVASSVNGNKDSARKVVSRKKANSVRKNAKRGKI
jgi:hypothetical protein